MTEDRGAFKTIPRNPVLSGQFVIGYDGCGRNAAPLAKKFSVGPRPPRGRGTLRYSRFGLIRRPAKRLSRVVHRVPFGNKTPANGNPCPCSPAFASCSPPS